MMKVVRRLRGGSFFLAVCAVSVVALGLSLQVVSAQAPKSKKAGGPEIKNATGNRAVPAGNEVRVGARLSQLRNIPILDPIFVDYREDSVSAGVASSSAPINPGTQVSRAPVGGIASVTGAACRQAAECNDCNPCTLDDCGTATCVGGDRDGFSCDPANNNCEGQCIGGINADCPGGTCDFTTKLCVGGANDGLTCTPAPCFTDSGCCGDAGVGGTIPDGTCNLFPCVDLTPPVGGGSQCINALIPPTLFVQGAECDDGLECNGGETCSGGLCVAGTPLCDPASNTVCDEPTDSCLPPCISDAECDFDADPCTTDVCLAKTCVGGINDGLPCRSTSDPVNGCLDIDNINNGTCTGGGTGECIVDTPLCGPGAGQCTPGFCIDSTPGQASKDGDPCTSDAQCGAGSCGCPKGRCCGGAGGATCTIDTFANCETAGGTWFATDDACRTIGQSTVRNICPLYGVGVAPQGTLVTAVGPILSTNPQGCPNTLFSAGDDYTATGGGTGFMSVEIVRFIASVQVQSRLTIEFWDTRQTPPIRVEDTFFVGSPGPGGPAIRTLVFDPPLVVPDSGVLALVNADRFTPLGQSSFLAVQDTAVVGTSDPSVMWLNGALTSGGELGMCSGGARDGLWCDLPGALATCPSGTCTDIDDTLGFEIVASPATDPTGACCSSATGSCSLKLPWVCEAEGGVFQGNGTFCRSCSNDSFKSCGTDADCPACTGDANTEGDPCVTDTDCGNGLCIATATCTPVPPACAVQGCCSGGAIGTIPVCNVFSNNAGFFCPNGDVDCDGPGGACSDTVDITEGDCVTIRGGCSTLDANGESVPCSQDSDCPTPGDTCLNNSCPTGTGTGTGNFGRSCAPSVCVQPQFVDCPGGVCGRICAGGTRDGLLCENCPGGACVAGVCDAGSRVGMACEDCATGGTCMDLCDGGGRDRLVCVKHSGGDNCFDTPVVEAPVPPLTSPATTITTTITGNNHEATYDDFNEGHCNGGTSDGAPCDPNAADQTLECPGGGTCDRLCGAGIFNPNGVTADPGWWEAFHLSKCANVRVGLCGSSLVIQPAWAFLSTGCPCANFLGNAGVAPPVGTGLGGEGSERGLPFCTLSDNLWQTFRNLPPGTYYYPILSDPDGTCAAPIANPDSAGCTYQLQITTGACLEAACCADAACVGGTDAGLPCDAAGLVACPDGECINGVCDAGILIGHACTAGSVDQCSGGGVCTAGPTCTQTNELRCTAAGGFFAAELNLPDMTCAGGPHKGNACTGDVDCPQSTCTAVASVTACPGGGGLGVCEFGACCNGPGECGDVNGADPLILFDRALCDVQTQNMGTFIAGSRCNFPEPPCPVCTAAETPGNCQADTAGFIWSIDLNGTNGGGPVADDFIANVPEISQFCFQPCFIQQDAGGNTIGECADPQGTVPPPPDQILVRFFDDGANDANPNTKPGFPGDLLPGSPPGPDPVQVAAKRWQGTRCWDYSVVFDPPIQGFVQGKRYWVEFSGKGSRDEAGNGCELFMKGSLEGNGWAFFDPDRFGTDITGQRTWDINDAWIWFENGVQQDFPFCIEGGFTLPPPMTGACCQCDGTCTDDVAPVDCLQGVDILNGGTAQTVNSTIGNYFPGETCAQISCLDVGAGGGCPGSLGEVGEDCGNPMCIGPAGTVCADGGPPEAGLELFEFLNVRGSNLCSSTDGPEQYANCSGAVEQTGNDQWFEVHAPATGKLNFDVCGSRLDVITAVYTNGTSTCPNDVNRGGTCPPASDPVFCTDQDCANTFDTPTGTRFVKDTCLGGANDGLPCPDGDTNCPGGTCEGECLLVRIAGDTGDVGTFQMEMQLAATNCPISSPPVQDVERGQPLTMNRALAFSAGDPSGTPGAAGLKQAIRVRIDSVTAPQHQYLVGSTWWVQQPTAFGEISSDPVPRPGGANFRASELGCTPFFRDWNGGCVAGACLGGLKDGTCQDGVCIGGTLEGSTCSVDTDCPGEPCSTASDCSGGIINIFGEMIFPGASYTVSVVGQDCDLTDPANFAAASLKISTSPYGNVAGLCDTAGCDVPDSQATAVADALAILAKFSNAAGSMRKMRSDTEPSALDFKTNVTDVLQALRAFSGLGYPFLSCQSTATQGSICFGGPTNLQSCTTDLDCRIPLCPGQTPPSSVASSR